MTTEEPTHDLFLALTPDRVLQAVEAAGLYCNPVCYALNSYENRVYEVELEDRSRIIAKFYRPSRWTEEQILEEHRFLTELEEAEVPVCGVLPFPDGSTLKQIDTIYYSLFTRMGGRAPDEITFDNAERLGMLLARIHGVGATRSSGSRVALTPELFVHRNLDWFLENKTIPKPLEGRYIAAGRTLAAVAEERLKGVDIQRIHGDFHQGNLIQREGLFHVLDFDDMAMGPPVQDVWLLMPGRDSHSRQLRELFLEGYETFRPFPRNTLRLIEPLRGMRMVHYAAWLARRWHDPVFPVTWPQFGTHTYWQEAVQDMEELNLLIQREERESSGLVGGLPEEEDLTNKDFFWDMED